MSDVQYDIIKGTDTVKDAFDKVNANFLKNNSMATQAALDALKELPTVAVTASKFYVNGQEITDWNDVQANGIYMKSSALNSPSYSSEPGKWWYVLVMTHDKLHTVQVAVSLTDSSPRIYVRAKVDGTWFAWSERKQYTPQAKLLTFYNNWVNYSATGSVACKFGNQVSVMGRIKGGNLSGNVFELPWKLADAVGQFVVPIYYSNGNTAGSLVIKGTVASFVQSIGSNADINFSFSYYTTN